MKKALIPQKPEDVRKIAEKARECRNPYASKGHLYEYAVKGIAAGRVIPLMVFKNGRGGDMEGGAILTVTERFGEKVFWLDFCWVEPGSDITKDFLKQVEDLARDMGIKKIVGAMTRGEQAAYRKYGFKTEVKIVSKEV